VLRTPQGDVQRSLDDDAEPVSGTASSLVFSANSWATAGSKSLGLSSCSDADVRIARPGLGTYIGSNEYRDKGEAAGGDLQARRFTEAFALHSIHDKGEEFVLASLLVCA
jgi:hypothetical protein